MSRAASKRRGGTLSGLSVFAVEDTAVQVMWRRATAGTTIRVGDERVEITESGPGVAGFSGLQAGSNHDVMVDGRRVGRIRTLRPPPGALLYRFATISDLHVGERSFGLAPRFHERPDVDTSHAYPARCAAAALAEAAEWGAASILVKGDLTWAGRHLEWDVVGRTLAASPVEVHVTLGNHDVVPRSTDGHLALARHGVQVHRDAEVVDQPGIRIVLAHSAARHHRFGHLDDRQHEQIVDAVRTAPAAFLTMHHYVDRWPFVTRYPAGIPRDDGTALFSAVARANPATFVSVGHTHRNRRRVLCGLTATEVGSTKDYPGVWAGYAVHEGGIRQVVRRVTDRACLDWTERTAASVAGLWGPWSAGRRSWRCFSQSWPDR